MGAVVVGLGRKDKSQEAGHAPFLSGQVTELSTLSLEVATHDVLGKLIFRGE